MKRLAAMVLSCVMLLSAACASKREPTAHTASMDAELRQATERYAQLVRKMDNAAIAQMFTPDGELVAPGKTPPRGPAEIGQYLDGFKQYQVRSEVMTVDNVLANGLSAHVTGRYDQKVRLPAGNEVEAKGRYEADWNRGDDGVWRLRRLAAYPG